MELVTAPVEVQRSLTLPLDETLIMPISDVQFGSAACDVDRFQRHVEWGVKNKVYFIGIGDYVDYASPSNRRRLRSLIAAEELYDITENTLDDAAQDHLERFQEILKPTRGRWLGLTRGHHYWEYADGTTSDMRLAGFLGCPFLGDCAIVNVKFIDPDRLERGHRKPPEMNIWAHHGRGNGTLQSAPLNKLERMANFWEDVDVFLLAHHHKKVTAKLQRIRPIFLPSGKHKLVHRNIIIAGTGGFLKGYMAGSTDGKGRPSGTYVERGMMTPVALGGVVIWARPRYEGHAMWPTVDIDVSL